MIFTELAVLAEVTDEMMKLKQCPECLETERLYQEDPKTPRSPCSICHRAAASHWLGLNPDQTAWWEALMKAPLGKIASIFTADETPVIFCEVPKSIDCPVRDDAILCEQSIFRPEGGNGPWPKILKDLLQQYSNDWYKGKTAVASFEYHAFKDASFALATPETASVYKSFGIETWVKA